MSKNHKNPENSLFSKFYDSAVSDQDYENRPEMAPLGPLESLYININYPTSFNDIFPHFEKNRFFDLKKLVKILKIDDFKKIRVRTKL